MSLEWESKDTTALRKLEWYKAFFEGNVRAGAAGAMFWILTPDARRGYGVTYSTPRDQELLSEIARASQMFAALQSAELPSQLQKSERHLIPRQFAWTRAVSRSGDVAADDSQGRQVDPLSIQATDGER